ncbi:P27 family phage terminase small subunit [Gluconobacter cerinus]|uniref:P27 family phage terminase small subunit n=1 Tax=Gluconobacter cerinus TaxID=38307 RepID=UPI001B8AC445|nr:P27 family phage terminase small subunit [Gluconobacter cerinus]MBS0984594.1 P27 family phage terminase small subunit [Gluconobacter cerinus]
METREHILKNTNTTDLDQFEPFIKMFEDLVEDYRILKQLIEQEGYTYKAGGLTKPNPAVAQLRETQKQMLSLSRRFGLTPYDLNLLKRDQLEQAQEEDFSEFGDLDE